MTRHDRPYLTSAVPTRPRSAGGRALREIVLACLVGYCFAAGVVLAALVVVWQAGLFTLVWR
jgi:hypothetical protein